MPNKLEVVPATAGKRLGAAVLDWLPPVTALTILLAIGFAGITRSQSGGFIVYDTSSLVLFGGIGAGLTLVYLVVLATLEGRTGATLGNRLMGIRCTDADGFAPGGGAVFLRGLITGAGVLLAVLAAATVVMFQWFGVALLVLGPLLFLGAAWAVLVVLSSAWDRNGQLRGWHDTAAKTLVFDVKSGRNPVTTGGIAGPYSFAPLNLPPVQQVASPLAAAARGPRPSLNPNQWQPPAAVQPAPAADWRPAAFTQTCRTAARWCAAAAGPAAGSARGVVRTARRVPRPFQPGARIPMTTTTARRSAATPMPRSPWRCSGSGSTTAATSNWTAPC